MSFSFGSKKSTTKQSAQSDPWEPTIPYLTDFLSKIDIGGSTGLTPDQQTAYNTLKTNAGQGNPWETQIAGLTNDLFGTQSQSGTVTDAYATLKDQLTPYANGSNLDLENNPYVQRMLQTVTDDAVNRQNRMFAGAGRDLSGANSAALGKAVTDAQLPVLANLYQDAQGKQIDASKTLFGAGTTTGTTVQGLNKDALGTQGAGIDAAKAALDARDLGPNTILNLEEQIKQLPLQELQTIASVLFPAAQLGQQTEGRATTKGAATNFGLDFGKLFAGLGTLGA